ncbi:MAG: T9SS type A sorting domain-containing protein, partial [Ignavibacteriae bacterium]|nr:T9SS type A sorting domain-containing protein [Ignavibacteriota bacterium]
SYNDFVNGECKSPDGGLIGGITPVDSFGFEVDFTDFDRKIFIGNNSYVIDDWMLDWYTESPWAHRKILEGYSIEIYNPKPMLGEEVIAFIDSVDELGKKVFTKMNVDYSTMYFVDPDFIVPATNLDTLLLFVHAKWHNSEDYNWSYKPEAGFRQTWPLPENLAYNNSELQTAAMGNFPLGDLNWYPDLLDSWEAQKYKEWEHINHWLNYGEPLVDIDVTKYDVITEFRLEQNYPNPFNPSTEISFSLPERSFVSIKVYDILGKEITQLVNEEKSAGAYSVICDASKFATGIYFYTISAGKFIQTKKMTLIK